MDRGVDRGIDRCNMNRRYLDLRSPAHDPGGPARNGPLLPRRSGSMRRRYGTTFYRATAGGKRSSVTGTKGRVDSTETWRGGKNRPWRIRIWRRRLIIRPLIVAVLDLPQRVESYDKRKGSHEQNNRLEHRDVLLLRTVRPLISYSRTSEFTYLHTRHPYHPFSVDGCKPQSTFLVSPFIFLISGRGFSRIVAFC